MWLLLPVSWIYGLGVRLRNQLFEWDILKSRRFSTPTICVGNITVGGTGKTPLVEYLIRLLSPHYKVAVLSRGYKRKTSGYVLADQSSTARDIGDEPCQMKTKYPKVTVAVDEDRCEGIRRIESDKRTRKTEVILLDDAYQHRYVKAGLTILLVDYHRPIHQDRLLPAGRLREPQSGRQRADIVIVTKCPPSLTSSESMEMKRSLQLDATQRLFFSTMAYLDLKPLYCGTDKPLGSIHPDCHLLLVTGIANPRPLMETISTYSKKVSVMTYPDHHSFTAKDIYDINQAFTSLPSPKLAITTEKDAVRLQSTNLLSEELRHQLYELPIEAKILQDQESEFNEIIISYVQEHPRDRILAEGADDHKS